MQISQKRIKNENILLIFFSHLALFVCLFYLEWHAWAVCNARSHTLTYSLSQISKRVHLSHTRMNVNDVEEKQQHLQRKMCLLLRYLNLHHSKINTHTRTHTHTSTQIDVLHILSVPTAQFKSERLSVFAETDSVLNSTWSSSIYGSYGYIK